VRMLERSHSGQCSHLCMRASVGKGIVAVCNLFTDNPAS
jgi:hypothetical protein